MGKTECGECACGAEIFTNTRGQALRFVGRWDLRIPFHDLSLVDYSVHHEVPVHSRSGRLVSSFPRFLLSSRSPCTPAPPPVQHIQQYSSTAEHTCNAKDYSVADLQCSSYVRDGLCSRARVLIMALCCTAPTGLRAARIAAHCLFCFGLLPAVYGLCTSFPHLRGLACRNM